jgi:hypothetical protein
MLNEAFGCQIVSGATAAPKCTGKNPQDTVVPFTFDKNADGSDAASLTKVTFPLTNRQQIRDAIQCTGGTTSNCAAYAVGLTASSNMSAGVTVNSVAQANQNFTVTTNNNGGPRVPADLNRMPFETPANTCSP